MNKDKEQGKEGEQGSGNQADEGALQLKNPFKDGDDQKISQEDIEKEQEYKEALTERD